MTSALAMWLSASQMSAMEELYSMTLESELQMVLKEPGH
jgi:hypothetical protein